MPSGGIPLLSELAALGICHCVRWHWSSGAGTLVPSACWSVTPGYFLTCSSPATETPGGGQLHHRLRLSLGSSPPISPTPFLAGVKRGVAEEAWGVPVGSGQGRVRE